MKNLHTYSPPRNRYRHAERLALHLCDQFRKLSDEFKAIRRERKARR